MDSCPFGTKNSPCPTAEVYAGLTVQKQGTAYCPLHGRFAYEAKAEEAPSAPIEAEVAKAPAEAATTPETAPTAKEGPAKSEGKAGKPA